MSRVVDVPEAIRVQDLRKAYGAATAVDGISFSVGRGEVFAFLGPNGAGKSTTIGILCTLVRASSGSATVAGYDVATSPEQVRARIGIVFQESTLDKQLTAEENLRFHAVLYHVPRRARRKRIAEVLELVGLASRRKDLVADFSGGMMRRLEIARALLHTPDVLFLDEPTIGLDPQTRVTMWDGIMRMRREEGITVFLTTHYMDEAEVADRIGIIDRGRIATLGTPVDIKAAAGSETVELHSTDDDRALAAVTAAGFTARKERDHLLVDTANAERQIPRLLAAVGEGVLLVRVHEPTLDDAFLHYTGREIRDESAEGRPSLPAGWRSR